MKNRHMLERKMVATLFVASIALLIGCSTDTPTQTTTGDSQILTQEGTTQNDNSTTVTAVSTTPLPTPKPAVNNTWYYTNEAGYSYALTIWIYEPIKSAEQGVTTHPDDSSKYLESSNYNSQTDLVIPATFVIENTTDGFDLSADLDCTITNGGLLAGTADVLVDQCFSDGNSDKFLSDYYYFGVQWSDPLQSQESAHHVFFIIINNYFSPNSPDGKSELLDQYTIWPIAMAGFTATNEEGMTLNGKVISM